MAFWGCSVAQYLKSWVSSQSGAHVTSKLRAILIFYLPPTSYADSLAQNPCETLCALVNISVMSMTLYFGFQKFKPQGKKVHTGENRERHL